MKIQEFKKHIMTGISFLIPMVVMAGIMGAIQKAFSWSGVDLSEPLVAGLNYSGYSIAKLSDFMHMLGEMNANGFNWAYAFLCAGIAYSISDRPGIVPGFAIGFFAGGPTKTGFVGAMLMGFLIGWFVNWMKSWKVPKALQGLMPVLVIPVLSTMVGTFVFFGVFMRPISYAMLAFQHWIEGLASGSCSSWARSSAPAWASTWAARWAKPLPWPPTPCMPICLTASAAAPKPPRSSAA